MNGYSTLPKSQKLETHHQMQFSVIHRTSNFWVGRVIPLCRGYSQCIISSYCLGIEKQIHFIQINGELILQWKHSFVRTFFSLVGFYGISTIDGDLMLNLVYIGRLNNLGTHVTANNSNNNILFFFVLHLKIVYYNNYQSPITMPGIREENLFFVTTYLKTESLKNVSK